MCIISFVISSLLWFYVLSSRPQLEQSLTTAANELTWKAAGKDIAARPITYESGHGKKPGSEGIIPKGHWGYSWWFATSDKEWKLAEKELKARAHNEGAKNIHAAVGLKARIDIFTYFKAKEKYETENKDELYPPRGVFPEGISLRWANGQAPSIDLALDSYQTGILTNLLYSEDTIDAARHVVIKRSEYLNGLDFFKSAFRKESVSQSKGSSHESKAEAKLAIAELEAHIGKAPAKELGLVMYITGRDQKGSDYRQWNVNYQLIPIDQAFVSPGFLKKGLFFVQEIRVSKKKAASIKPGGLRPKEWGSTGKKPESVYFSQHKVVDSTTGKLTGQKVNVPPPPNTAFTGARYNEYGGDYDYFFDDDDVQQYQSPFVVNYNYMVVIIASVVICICGLMCSLFTGVGCYFVGKKHGNIMERKERLETEVEIVDPHEMV